MCPIGLVQVLGRFIRRCEINIAILVTFVAIRDYVVVWTPRVTHNGGSYLLMK